MTSKNGEKPLNRSAAIVPALSAEAQLKRKIRKELIHQGFKQECGELVPPKFNDKGEIRSMHRNQRSRLLEKNREFILERTSSIGHFFANGSEVSVDEMDLSLERILPGTWQSDLFRLATYTWSVPVSNGFGRRLRYLVWDNSNGKLAGVFALGDPVYNLNVRDAAIGWTTDTKKQNLTNVLDAYVLGAIPPYNMILTGKTIACLTNSREVLSDFRTKYGDTQGIISQKNKQSRLLAITTSSSMGRSSLYNRLKLGDRWFFRAIGYTKGWGHFHISDDLFSDMREYLRNIGHEYADGNRFGNGPNWKLRTIRVTLESVGLDPNMLRHGIGRQAFLSLTMQNSLQLLCEEKADAPANTESDCLSAKEISRLGTLRWSAARAKSRDEYRNHKAVQLLGGLVNNSNQTPVYPAIRSR